MAGATWMDERNDRKKQEEADVARLARAMEDRDEGEFIERYGPALRAGGHCLVRPDRGEAERERVAVIIQRDRRDREAELDRKVASHEISEGVYFNLTDTVVPPTPEFLAKTDVVPFTPDQQDGTVRTVSTVRVVRTPIIARLWRAGKISDDLARACLWYRMAHEYAGLEGRWSSSPWRGPNDISVPGYKGMMPGHIAMTHSEAEARQEFRQAVIAIEPMYREFFNQVVIHDLPLRNAARFAKCRNAKVLRRFRDCAEDLLDHLEARKIELPSPHDWTRA